MLRATMRLVPSLALLLCACAHALPPAETVTLVPPPPPAAQPCGDHACAVQHDESIFTGLGGVDLYSQSWRPSGASRAALIVVHGLRDHSSRYARMAERLADRGYAVHAFDLRGHGKSDGDRAYVDSFDDYVDDLELFVQRVAAREPGKPLFLFGHSMGGAVATLFALRAHRPALRGLVLSAPALQVGDDVPGPLVAVTRVLGGLAPSLRVLELETASFSRDAAVVDAIARDPLVEQRPGPARTAAQLLGAIGRIQDGMEGLDVPLLILHGTGDKLTNPAGSRALSVRARAGDKTLRLYPGLAHDLLHEPEHEQVLGDIAGWLDAHLPTASTTARR